MKFQQLLKTKRSFRQEFRKQIRLAITAAIGFTIAFSWRESVFDLFLNFTSRIFDLSIEHYTTKIYTAIFVTILGVVLIFFTSKILKEK
jgi:hypothetical protein